MSPSTAPGLGPTLDQAFDATRRAGQVVLVAIVTAGLLLLPALLIFATQLRGSEDPPPLPPGD